MKITQLFLAFVLALALIVAGYFLLPSQWLRNSGVLDLVVVLDWGAGNHDHLPTGVDGTRKLVKAVLPGDRLAIYAAGPQVSELVRGPVSSAAALSILDRQIAGLRPAIHGGTLIGESFAKVSAAFDGFLRNYSGKHRRMLVVFSDCVTGSLDASDVSNLSVAGQTSVLVIGFRSQNKDAVMQVLLGSDASNDVLIVPPGEAAEALSGFLETIRSQCHSLRVPRIVLLLAFSAAAGLMLSMGLSQITARRWADVSIRLTNDDDEGTSQVFALAEGGSVSIGGGEQLHDFAIPVEGSCSVARSAQVLSLLPGNGRLLLQRAGEPMVVTEPCPVTFGDTFHLEGTSVTLQKG